MAFLRALIGKIEMIGDTGARAAGREMYLADPECPVGCPKRNRCSMLTYFISIISLSLSNKFTLMPGSVLRSRVRCQLNFEKSSYEWRLPAFTCACISGRAGPDAAADIEP